MQLLLYMGYMQLLLYAIITLNFLCNLLYSKKTVQYLNFACFDALSVK